MFMYVTWLSGFYFSVSVYMNTRRFINISRVDTLKRAAEEHDIDTGVHRVVDIFDRT